MQEIEHNYNLYRLPDHCAGDSQWLLSMLYAIEFPKFPAGAQLIELQRECRIQQYEKTYTRVMKNNTLNTGEIHHKAQGLARRKANIELRERLETIKSMNSGKTIGLPVI